MARLDFDFRYVKYFKNLHWIYSYDNQGMYFQKNDIRVSIMSEGPTFTCYKNKKIGNNWVLMAKQPNLLTDKFVYAWMLANMT